MAGLLTTLSPKERSLLFKNIKNGAEFEELDRATNKKSSTTVFVYRRKPTNELVFHYQSKSASKFYWPGPETSAEHTATRCDQYLKLEDAFVKKHEDFIWGEYQKLPARILRHPPPDKKGLILCYKTGAGKTLAAVNTAYELLLDNTVTHAMFIVPATLESVCNIQKEIQKYWAILSDRADPRVSMRTRACFQPFDGARICVISHDTFRMDMNAQRSTTMDLLKDPTKRILLIIDEAHKMINALDIKIPLAAEKMMETYEVVETHIPASIASSLLYACKLSHRNLLLTATPLVNFLIDVVPLALACDEHALPFTQHITSNDKKLIYDHCFGATNSFIWRLGKNSALDAWVLRHRKETIAAMFRNKILYVNENEGFAIPKFIDNQGNEFDYYYDIPRVDAAFWKEIEKADMSDPRIKTLRATFKMVKTLMEMEVQSFPKHTFRVQMTEKNLTQLRKKKFIQTDYATEDEDDEEDDEEDDDQEDDQNDDQEDDEDDEDDNKRESFFNKTRRGSNDADDEEGKLNACIKNISSARTRYPLVVFANFIGAGLNRLRKMLGNNKKFKKFIDQKQRVAGNHIYAFITGETPNREAIVTKFNEGIIDVVFISKAGEMGLDLRGPEGLGMSEMHITESVWNDATLKQIMGRGLRKGAHNKRPPAERKLRVFFYEAAVPEGDDLQTGDMILGRTMIVKSIVSREFETIVAQESARLQRSAPPAPAPEPKRKAAAVATIKNKRVSFLPTMSFAVPAPTKKKRVVRRADQDEDDDSVVTVPPRTPASEPRKKAATRTPTKKNRVVRRAAHDSDTEDDSVVTVPRAPTTTPTKKRRVIQHTEDDEDE